MTILVSLARGHDRDGAVLAASIPGLSAVPDNLAGLMYWLLRQALLNQRPCIRPARKTRRWTETPSREGKDGRPR